MINLSIACIVYLFQRKDLFEWKLLCYPLQFYESPSLSSKLKMSQQGATSANVFQEGIEPCTKLMDQVIAPDQAKDAVNVSNTPAISAISKEIPATDVVPSDVIINHPRLRTNTEKGAELSDWNAREEVLLFLQENKQTM